MDDIFVYFVPLPDKVNEMVTPCADGYTIYIDERLNKEQRIRHYNHALRHILRKDFDSDGDVQMIEHETHRR